VFFSERLAVIGFATLLENARGLGYDVRLGKHRLTEQITDPSVKVNGSERPTPKPLQFDGVTAGHVILRVKLSVTVINEYFFKR
jgi:hypothetical protein